MSVLRGGCLCGDVRYEIDGELGPIGHCHCATCRAAHAAAFATTARVARGALRFRAGEERMRAYESSPGKKRYFCPRCGSHLVAAWDHDDEWILRVGSLHDDPGGRPVVHIWTEDGAPWYDLDASLPVLPRGAPPRGD